MDPASAIGLVATAVSLTSSCLRVCKIGPSKHSQDYLQSVSQELWDFNGSLKNLEDHYDIFEESQARSNLLPLINDRLLACETALKAIREHLESKNPVKKIVRGARFDAVLERHLNCLKRSRTLFHEALQADQMNTMSAVEKSVRNIAEDVQSLQTDVSGIDEHNRRNLDQLHGSLGSIHNGNKDILRSHEDSRARQQWQAQVQKDRSIMDWLSPLSFEAKHMDVLSSRAESTGTWILETVEFKDWAIGSGGTLWCTGMPGAGKTVVASIVVDHLRGEFQSQKVVISCVYCSYKDQALQTPTSLIASILYQILTITKFISDDLRALYERHELKKTRPRLEELFAELQACVQSLDKFFVIIDALDECSDVTRNEFLKHIRKLRPAANLMVTTRPASHSVNVYPEAVCVEIRAKDTDVRSYCEAKIKSDDRFNFMREDAKNDMINKLVENAQDMFLLTVLHVESLACQLNYRDIQDALKKLPKGLDDTYHEALQRIAHQSPPSVEMANKVLSWISHAYRPLTIEELQCALAVSPGLTAFDDDAMTPLNTLVFVCGGLVTFDPQSRIIRLVHYTTQEFLEKIRDSRFPTAQADITRTCLTHLSFDHPMSYNDRYKFMMHNIESSPFLTYAAQYWRDHMRASPETDFTELILQILGDHTKVQCILQAMDDRRIFHMNIHDYVCKTPLYVAATFGLESIVLLLLERGENLTESMMRKAFTIAVELAQLEVIKLFIDRGASVRRLDEKTSPLLLTALTAQYTSDKAAVDTASLLLDRGAGIDFQGGFDRNTALMEAAKGGYVGLVELLLTYGADVNIRNDHCATALHMADPRRPKIFQLLVEHGADVNACNDKGETTLSLVCGKYHDGYAEDIVRILLDSGADIHSTAVSGDTALLRAAGEGSCRIMQVLIEYGADCHVRNNYGRSALSTTIAGDCLQSGETVSLLLDLGVNIHLQDSDGDTALTLAAAVYIRQSYWDEREDKMDDTIVAAVRERNFITMELLLEHGASVAVKNKAGDTALTLAAAEGKVDAVELLLNHGADLHTKNEAGDTALTLAAAAEAILTPPWPPGEEVGIEDEIQLAAFAERNFLTLELLLNHGASFNAKNKAGDTALTLVTAKGKLDAVKLLLSYGANPQTRNEAGDTALTLAAAAEIWVSLRHASQEDSANQLAAFAKQNLLILELLLNHGASFNVKNKAGDTALTLAAAEGKVDAVKLLLDYGAERPR